MCVPPSIFSNAAATELENCQEKSDIYSGSDSDGENDDQDPYEFVEVSILLNLSVVSPIIPPSSRPTP